MIKKDIKIASLEWEIKWLKDVIEKLHKEIKFLEECLDNKEEVNKELRIENATLKDNNKAIKERVDEIVIAYMKFEEERDKFEKWFKKADYELDRVIMNR